MPNRNMIFFLIIILLFCFIPQASASEIDLANDEGLTIEQAIDMALLNSKILQQSDLDIEKANEQRKSLADAVKFIPMEASGSTEADQAYTALVSADIARFMIKKTRGINEDKIALAVFNAYVGVVQAGENVEYCRKALKNAQMEWNYANIKYQQGIISSLEKDIVHTQYKSAQNSLQSAEIDLTTAYQTLNELIGLSTDGRPMLSQKPAYSELGDCELETAVNRAVDANPSIWLAEQNVSLAQLQLKLFDWNSGNSYRASEITVEKAELSAAEAREQLRQSLRDIYYNIITLEDTYLLQQEVVKLAQNSARVKTVMFEVGVATKLETQIAQLELQKAQSDLDKIVFQHEYLKLVFAKPWSAM